MPRQKVAIQPIEKRQSQQVTLSKRRKGLFKKAKEIGTMCNAKIGVIIFSAANNLTHYAYPCTLDEIIRRRYQTQQLEKSPVDLELMQEYERVKTKFVEEELIVSQMEGSKHENLPMEQLDQLEEMMENTLRLVREKTERACYEAGVQQGQQVQNSAAEQRDLPGLSHENIVAEQVQRDLPGLSNNIVVEQRDQPGPSNVEQEQAVVPEERSVPNFPIANDTVLDDSFLKLSLGGIFQADPRM